MKKALYDWLTWATSDEGVKSIFDTVKNVATAAAVEIVGFWFLRFSQHAPKFTQIAFVVAGGTVMMLGFCLLALLLTNHLTRRGASLRYVLLASIWFMLVIFFVGVYIGAKG
jgi:hypothetical protein